jgi:NADPH2:quinone reductase
MARAIRFHRTGGPEVLQLDDVPLGPPAAGEVRLKQTAIGINFADVYNRTGLYSVKLPAILGQEAAGIVEELGPGVTEVKPGDRVVYAGAQGAYADVRNVPASVLVPIPAGITDEIAAASMLKGTTAEYLLRQVFPVKRGDTILFHAAAGGVGTIACQWAKHLGATVIGTVGRDEKVPLAKANGCAHVIVSSREDIAQRVREITGGKGVPVVYDSVGKDTFEASLNCLQPRGMMVSYGNASGPVPPFSPLLLTEKGSLFFTRPSRKHYSLTREETLAAANALFAVILSGAVKVAIGARFPLADAAKAHAALESRATTGALLLQP